MGVELESSHIGACADVIDDEGGEEVDVAGGELVGDGRTCTN